jgi:uncharacterized protein (DUF58 family)
MILVNRLFYWGYRATDNLWHWARRRFTLAGLCMVAGFVLAGVASVDIENAETYQSFASLLGFLLLAIAGSFFFRSKFAVRRFLPRIGTAGQPLHYRVAIKNQSATKQTGLTWLEDLADPRPTFAEWLAFHKAEGRRVRPFVAGQRRRKSPFRLATVKAVEVPPLAEQGEAEIRMEIFPLRRGILHFKSATLARPDPFGLFRSFITVPAAQTILILPKRYPIPPITLQGALRYQECGVAPAANPGRSEEFFALREYRHGDPLRHIHWRSWARTGKPIVKEFEDAFLARHALVLDTFDDEPDSEVFEEAVSIAASFACTILTQESRLDLLFVSNQSYCFTAGRGLAHVDDMLKILALVSHCRDKKFEVLEQLVLNHIPVVSGCICILQKWDEVRKGFVEKLRVFGVQLLVLVVMPPGQTKPDAGPLRDTPECFHVLEVGEIAEKLAQLR